MTLRNIKFSFESNIYRNEIDIYNAMQNPGLGGLSEIPGLFRGGAKPKNIVLNDLYVKKTIGAITLSEVGNFHAITPKNLNNYSLMVILTSISLVTDAVIQYSLCPLLRAKP